MNEDQILNYIEDDDKYIKDQVSNDRGVLLAPFDGSEDSITLDNGSVLYIYRRN